MNHDVVEKNIGLMIIFIIVAISFGALVEIVPLFFQKQTTEPIAGLKPLNAMQLTGRDIYIREGCHVCHSQMVRPMRSETTLLVSKYTSTTSCGAPSEQGPIWRA